MSNSEDKTLCALQEEGYIASNMEDFMKLIQPAQFFCKNCGRSAVSDNNLCNPEKLTRNVTSMSLLLIMQATLAEGKRTEVSNR